jgi:hypothetical protein
MSEDTFVGQQKKKTLGNRKEELNPRLHRGCYTLPKVVIREEHKKMEGVNKPTTLKIKGNVNVSWRKW